MLEILCIIIAVLLMIIILAYSLPVLVTFGMVAVLFVIEWYTDRRRQP